MNGGRREEMMALWAGKKVGGCIFGAEEGKAQLIWYVTQSLLLTFHSTFISNYITRPSKTFASHNLLGRMWIFPLAGKTNMKWKLKESCVRL